MEYITNWITSIVIYFLLITVVMQIVPDESYRKYMKVFIGMILMILLLQPATHLLGLEDQIAVSFERAVNALDMDTIKNQLSLEEEAVYAGLTRDYTEQMKEKADELVRKEGYELLSFSVRDGGVFMTIRTGGGRGSIVVESIIIGETQEEQALSREESVKTEAIKNSFSGFYNIEPEHINITIQR